MLAAINNNIYASFCILDAMFRKSLWVVSDIIPRMGAKWFAGKDGR